MHDACMHCNKGPIKKNVYKAYLNICPDDLYEKKCFEKLTI